MAEPNKESGAELPNVAEGKGSEERKTARVARRHSSDAAWFPIPYDWSYFFSATASTETRPFFPVLTENDCLSALQLSWLFQMTVFGFAAS